MMKLLYYTLSLWLLLWAHVNSTSAQGTPIPAFPEIIQESEILSSSSSQFYLKMTSGGDELLKKKTKKVKGWMVNLKEEDSQNIHFLIRTAKLKPLYEGKIHLHENGGWEVTFSEAMPGQSVMLLFVADHLVVNKGRIAIRPQTQLSFPQKRLEAGKNMVKAMNEIEQELDFERWGLRQLRKFGDKGTNLSKLREQAAEQLREYLQAALAAK